MSTATGDLAIDWSAAGNSDPYTNANFTLVDTGFNFLIVSNTVKASNTGSGQFGRRRWFYNGASGAASGSATLRSKIEIANAATGDEIAPAILKSDGSGYILAVNQTSWNIKTINAAGTVAGLVSGTAGSAASGDVAMLELNQTTHTLSAFLNGALVGAMLIIDSTYTTGLAPSISLDPENANASTIRSWAGDGITVGASSPGSPWDRRGAMGVMVTM